MTLRDWLDREEQKIPQFAQVIGRTAETVRRYISGDRIPDKETMPLIVQATGGAVTPNDFFGIAGHLDATPKRDTPARAQEAA